MTYNLSSFDNELMNNVNNLKNDTIVIIGSASVGIISNLTDDYFFAIHLNISLYM